MEALFAKLVEVFGKNLPQRYIWLIFLSPYIIEILCIFNESTRLYWENSNTIKPIIWIVSSLAGALLILIFIDFLKKYCKKKRNEREIDSAYLNNILDMSNHEKHCLVELYLKDHREESKCDDIYNIPSLIELGFILLADQEYDDYGQIVTQYIRLSQKAIDYLSADDSRVKKIRDSLPSEYKKKLSHYY